jgi:hypothetical protein
MSLNRKVEVTKSYKDGAADARGAPRMASVNVPDTKNELTDGTVGSVDAATRAEIGPYWKSRFSTRTPAELGNGSGSSRRHASRCSLGAPSPLTPAARDR